VDLPLSTQVEISIRPDDIDFQVDGSGNSLIIERSFRGAFNLYRLRLDSGQILHAFTEHTRVHPIGLRVQTYVTTNHSLNIFSSV